MGAETHWEYITSFSPAPRRRRLNSSTPLACFHSRRRLLSAPELRLREGKAMSYMKGDLLTKTRKLVKGLAKAEPTWLKAMEQAPPVTFPRSDGKLKAICLPEDVYVQKFFKRHPDSKHEDAIKINSFNPVPARIFAWRVLDLKEQGVNEEEAITTADLEYRSEKRAKKQAYARLKQIAKIQGKKPPPNPYPSAIREIQAEERKYVRDRFFDPEILELVKKMKETRIAEQERFRSGGV